MPEKLVRPSRTARQAPAPPPAFHCALRDGGLDAAWVRVTGELDIATVPQLRQTLGHVKDHTSRVVVDLRELAFMDRSAVQVIVDASVRATSAGGQLVLVRGPAQVDRVLALTGARDHLDIVDLNPAEPPVQALVQLAQREHGMSPAAASAA